MRTFQLLFAFCALIVLAYGQDSYSGENTDVLLEKSVNSLKRKEYAQAEEYLRVILERQEELDNATLPKVYNNMGVVNYGLGNYDQGIEYYRKALRMYKTLGNDTLYAQALFNMGLAYKEIAEDSLASHTIYRSVYVFRRLGLWMEEASALNSLGNLYRDAGAYKRSEDYLTQALAIRQENGYDQGVAYSEHALGMLFMESGEYDRANAHLRRALAQKEELGLTSQLANTYAQLGLLYMSQGDCDSAKIYLDRSCDIRYNSGELALAMNNLHLGEWHLQCGTIRESIPFFLKAGQTLENLGGKKDLLLVYEGLARAYEDIGEYEKAYHIEKKHSVLRTALQEEAGRKELARLAIQYDLRGYKQSLAMRTLENDYLRTRSNWLITGGVILVVLLFIISFLYRLSAGRKRRIEMQNTVLQSKNQNIIALHDELVHRTNNFVTLISGMMLRDRTDTSKPFIDRYLAWLSAISRVQGHLVLEPNGKFNTIHLAEYMKTLVEEAQVIYGVEIELDFVTVSQYTVNYQLAARLGICLNEFINNSVKHNTGSSLMIRVSIRLTDKEVQMEYRDSGAIETEAGGGNGLSLIRELLSPVQGTIDIIPGTSFHALICVHRK